MAVKRLSGSLNVLEASEERIKNVFATGLDVHMAMSGGKDSIVMSDIVYNLIQRREIDPKQLTVIFVDEEAIFDDVEAIVKEWRQKFMLVGAKFIWYCIQIRHFNCLDSLEEDETFITWDRFKEDVWVRKMPEFAVTNHPLLRERVDTYQEFLERVGTGVIQLVGVRVAEGTQRLQNIINIFSNPKNEAFLRNGNYMYPIYDWKDDDVWLHIKRRNLRFPRTYMDLWAIGEGRRGMRLSQFFSIDTAMVLVRLDEHQPGLMERVMKREPNAYLASLYWDSEMFGSATKTPVESLRPTNESNGKELDEDFDYKTEVMLLLSDIPRNFQTSVLRKTAKTIRGIILKLNVRMLDSHWKRAYEILMIGDPKLRHIRGWSMNILTQSEIKYLKEIEKD